MKRILRILAIGVIGLCVLSVLAAVVNGPSPTAPTQTAPTQPANVEATTAATIPPSPTPLAVPSPTEQPTSGLGDGYASGGLGLDRADFAARHGESTGKGLIGDRFAPSMDVSFIDGGRAWMIYYDFPKGGFVSLSDSEAIAKTLLPVDAKLERTYFKDEVRPVQVFMSKSLAERFKAERFDDKDGNETPGLFIVLHRVQPKESSNAGQVSGFIVAVGNTP